MRQEIFVVVWRGKNSRIVVIKQIMKEIECTGVCKEADSVILPDQRGEANRGIKFVSDDNDI